MAKHHQLNLLTQDIEMKKKELDSWGLFRGLRHRGFVKTSKVFKALKFLKIMEVEYQKQMTRAKGGKLDKNVTLYISDHCCVKLKVW